MPDTNAGDRTQSAANAYASAFGCTVTYSVERRNPDGTLTILDTATSIPARPVTA